MDARWLESERRRVVRLCAVISGDRDAAEDLAQETLLEAWRGAHKLHDPAGADRWLSAIARNVCLRWARRRGRELALPGDTNVESAFDLEVELERSELAELLDRALALLPPATRDVLVKRYVDDSPHAEIAAQLGLTEDAVSMRISRGTLALRRLLGSELRDDAAAFGLLGAADEWQETRVWCSQCGTRRLAVQRDDEAVSFRCPDCEPDVPSAQFRLTNPELARVVGDLVRPAAILKRAKDWSWRYFGGGGDHVACTGCGREVRVQTYARDDERFGAKAWGLYTHCDACGEAVSSSVTGLALATPDVRAFVREHPRTRALPEREIERDGGSAVVLRFEDVRSTAAIDAVFARDGVRLLEVAS